MDRRMVFADIVNKVHRSNGKVRGSENTNPVRQKGDTNGNILCETNTTNKCLSYVSPRPYQHKPSFSRRLRSTSSKSSVEEDLYRD